jgi:hypothetical protein
LALRAYRDGTRLLFAVNHVTDQSLLNVQWKGKCSETELQRAVRREEKRTNQIV